MVLKKVIAACKYKQFIFANVVIPPLRKRLCPS